MQLYDKKEEERKDEKEGSKEERGETGKEKKGDGKVLIDKVNENKKNILWVTFIFFQIQYLS